MPNQETCIVALAARIWSSVVNGEAQTKQHMFPCLSKSLNLDVCWSAKTQFVRHTANWIKASPPPLVYITVH